MRLRDLKYIAYTDVLVTVGVDRHIHGFIVLPGNLVPIAVLDDLDLGQRLFLVGPQDLEPRHDYLAFLGRNAAVGDL